MHKIVRILFFICSARSINATSELQVKLKKSFTQEKNLQSLLCIKQKNVVGLLKSQKQSLTNKEKALLNNYFKAKLLCYITDKKIDITSFKFEEQSIKNQQARSIFYKRLVAHLFIIFTKNNKNCLKFFFNKLYEGSTKWLVRLLYHRLHNTLVDDIGLVQAINKNIQDDYLESWLTILYPNQPKQLSFFSTMQALLLHITTNLKERDLKNSIL